MRAVVLMVFVAFAAGCAGNCQVVAENICSCEPTETAQRTCLQLLDDEAAQREVTEEQEASCATMLETCTDEAVCGLLRAGDLAACGLAFPGG